MCDRGANEFIEKYFRDCVYTTRDGIGFGFGLLSIGFWLVTMVPQFVLNIKTQSVEALSSWFLAQWLLGDTCNLVGCLLTNSQLPTQTYTAMYFIMSDIVMMVQYIYYGALQRHRDRVHMRCLLRQQRHLHYMHSNRDSEPIAAAALAGRSSDEESGIVGSSSSGHLQTSSSRPSASANKRGVVSRTFACLVVLAFVQHQAIGGWRQPVIAAGATSGRRLLAKGPLMLGHGLPAWARVSGVWLGYLSSVFYLSSRLSQIYKNWSRKCTEGLSIAMFLCAISANVSYGLGILIRSYSLDDLIASAPWLLGSLGVVTLDIVISCQTFSLPSDDGKERLRTPLLVTTPAGREPAALIDADRRQ